MVHSTSCWVRCSRLTNQEDRGRRLGYASTVHWAGTCGGRAAQHTAATRRQCAGLGLCPWGLTCGVRGEGSALSGARLQGGLAEVVTSIHMQ